jgi:phospholipase C
VNNPPAQPPTVSSFNTILHSASLSSGATASPADLQLFAGVITVGVELPNAWTFLEQDGQQVSQNGFLNCPEAELFFDTDLFDVGDHVLTFGAQGNVSGPGSPSFPVEYQVMIRIEATLDAKGKTIALTPSQFPNNIYRIKHFFVLMLENRSFDHMFAANDDLRSMLTEATVNPLSSPSGSAQFRVSPPDPLAAIDPSHDIGNVLFQLVGTGASLATGGLEPPPPNPLQAQHFIDDFKGVNSVVSCMDPAQGAAYALNELAENFLVLERWHSSLPGPTWPNRFFLHCGTSGGIAYSPDDLGTPGIVDFTTGDGFHFKNGSIFDRLTKLGIPWRIYHDGNAQVWALQGLSPLDDFAANAPLLDVTIRDTIVSWLLSNTTPDKVADITELVGELLPIVFALFVTTGPLSLVAMFAVAEEIYWVVHQFCGKDLTVDGGNERDFSAFSGDVADGGYQPFYTFIEPNQGESNGNSGHPNYGDEALSEDLIARIYESLRASPMWSAGECALLIVYDEHGGIYDRVTPPSDPGYNPHDDEYRTTYDSQLDALGVDQLHDQFDFSLLGVRVPAVLISPYTSRAHGGPAPSTTTIYEHSSVVRTLQRRVQDPNYLSTRVAFTQDLYAVFGTTPLAPGDTDLSPKALTKYKKPEMHRAARPSPARSIPARSSPNVNFMLDRAAELAYRCELATDPTILGQIVANVRTLPTPAARLAAVKEALGARLQAHRDARAKLQTMSDANGYLADADVALAEYRKRVAALDASYKATWNQRSIKDKYTAFRAMVTATARRPS